MQRPPVNFDDDVPTRYISKERFPECNFIIMLVYSYGKKKVLGDRQHAMTSHYEDYIRRLHN